MAEIEFDAWLRDGGIVVAASDRTARALTSAYHRRRQAEALTAWNAPRILSWRAFVEEAWAQRALDGRLLMNTAQELSLWTRIAGRDNLPATALDGPRRRVAALAAEAHELLATHAPRYLQTAARAAWQQDAAVFSGWLAEFDKACSAEELLPASRLPQELIRLLENYGGGNGSPLLVVGFDRILPVQRKLFDAWGSWQEAGANPPAAGIAYYAAPDAKAELAACALWCRQRIEANPNARLLVVTQDVSLRRGEIERAFLAQAGAGQFEFSLGVPLTQAPTARSAALLLRWLAGSLDESEVDWLIATGHTAASEQETAALHRHMREIRRRNRQRPRWTLDAFCHEHAGGFPLPAAWTARMTDAWRRLATAAEREQRPLEWAALVPQLLKTAAWPGARALSSVEFQAASRWQQAVETCGSLGFDGRRMRWQEFLSVLLRELEETLFAPESRDAPILIAGPAESAGLNANAVWMLGANEETWPVGGSSHPFLPIHVQRESAMPHATPQLDWELARAITARLVASAHEVRFSYARQSEDSEARSSRLVTQIARPAQPLPAEFAEPAHPPSLTVSFDDTVEVPLARTEIRGGAGVLTSQSQCAFKAFATARLGAQGWEPAEAGLTAAQRGKLLHAVLNLIWSRAQNGIKSSDELLALADRRSFVAERVQRVLREDIPQGVRERMPRRYLELEGARLIHLVTEWLDYEATRLSFSVSETESDRAIELAGLHFQVRLDRIDKLNDGSLLVIDYKSGNVSPKSWELPQPDDVQLPLYAGFALNREEEPLGGLVFAKLRAGEGKQEFAGQVFQPAATLFSSLKGSSALLKNALSLDQLSAWRDCIEGLAREFVAGRAEVNPREYPQTCERCGLETLCRVRETGAVAGEDHDGEDEGDE